MQAFRWLIAVAITYPVAFCCIFAANFLVLDRLIDFTKPEENNVSRWRMFGRILVGIATGGSAIGLCANIGASALFEQAAQDFLKAESTGSVFDLRQAAISKATIGTKLFFGFLLFEAIMLLLSIGAFSYAGAISARRIRTALQSAAHDLRGSFLQPLAPEQQEALDRAAITGNKLRRQIIGTCIIVFFSFSLRAVFSTIMAVAVIGQTANVPCPGFSNRCDKCYNTYSHMLVYLLYTPEFMFCTVLISQPLALLVLLWGMTSGLTLAIMKAGQV